MAGPITWRNVGGDGGRMGAALLRGGQDQLMGAGDTLLRTLDQFRKVNTANAGIIKQNNTQDFLDQVAAVADPAQLASPEVQAQLEQARLGYGNNIDRGVAREALPNQLASLQKAALATQSYNDVTQEVAERPVLEDLAERLYKGDTEGYNNILDTQNLRNEDKLRGALAQRLDDVTNQGYRAAGEKRAQGAEGRAIQSFNLSQEVGKENLANTRSERQYRDATREAALSSEAIKMVADESAGKLAAIQAQNPFANGTTDPTKDAKSILTNAGIVDKKGDGEFDSVWGTNAGDRQSMQEGVTSLISKGVPVKLGDETVDIPIPPAMVESYLQSVKGTGYWSSKSATSDMSDYFTNVFKNNPELGLKALEGAKAKKDHNSLVSELKKADQELRLSKNPKLSSTLQSIQALRDKVGGITVPAGAMLPDSEEDLKY